MGFEFVFDLLDCIAIFLEKQGASARSDVDNDMGASKYVSTHLVVVAAIILHCQSQVVARASCRHLSLSTDGGKQSSRCCLRLPVCNKTIIIG